MARLVLGARANMTIADRLRSSVLWPVWPVVLALPLAACSASSTPGAPDPLQDPITSISGTSRDLAFQGMVYVGAAAGDDAIADAVRAQQKSAFGAFRTTRFTVNQHLLETVDPSTFVKTPVTAIDVTKTGDAGKPLMRVTYTYHDLAIVPDDLKTTSSVAEGLLVGDYDAQADRVYKECGDPGDPDFKDSPWYVFDPQLDSCQQVMKAEADAIEADRVKLADAKTQVPLSEVNRLYLPIRVELSGDHTNGQASYPEYDRLYSGGVQSGKLVIALVDGLLTETPIADDIDDDGYPEWWNELSPIFAQHPGFTLAAIEPQEDLTTYTVNGNAVSAPGGFFDVLKWETTQDGWPDAIASDADKRALRSAAGKKLIQHWLTFDLPVSVSIGGAPARPFTIEITTYFGSTAADDTPHKRGIKNADVFVYNGHSSMGSGPLAPSNFSSDDFPASYQILFFDGCLSYNYYEKEFFGMHAGGSKNLDLITNGIEAPIANSGEADAAFVNALIDGAQRSYTQLLDAAKDTDSLRVVDGELDNSYSPSATPIEVTVLSSGG